MTTAARNDENLAFMPSSNDALYSAVTTDTTSAKSPANTLPPRSTSSPYFTSPNVRSSVNSSKAQSPMSLPPSLPRSKSSRDRQASSQSQTQPTTITSSDDDPDPADQVFWYNLHMETLANFERERSTWRKLTDRLTKEVECLRQELHHTRTRAVKMDPRADSAFASNVATAVTSTAPLESTAIEEEDDKVFLDRAIIAQAHAKLRELSVTSPDKEVGNPFDKPSPTTVDGVTLRARAPVTRQSSESKSRATSQTRKVTISDLVTPIEEISSNTSTDIPPPDSPPSPPQTARSAQSPPPHNFIMHAGNTPISIRARLARESLFGRLAEANKAALNPAAIASTTGLDPASELSVTLPPKPNQTSPPKTNSTNTTAGTLPTSSAALKQPRKESRQIPLPPNGFPIDGEISDGDRELRSPKMLPTNPSTPNVQLKADPFSILAQKLEMVAADPEHPRNQPEVLRSCRVLAHEDELGVGVWAKKRESERDLGKGKGAEGVGLGLGLGAGGAGEEEGEGKEGQDGGKEEIQIKLKKSSNFGSQLGQLR